MGIGDILRTVWRRSRRRAVRVETAGALNSSGRLEAIHLRPVEKDAQDAIDMRLNEGGVAIAHFSGKEVVGVRIADSQGTSLSADRNGEAVSYQIEGKRRQNEQGNVAVASILVARLNMEGASWEPPKCKDPKRGRPSEREDGIDCIAAQGDHQLLLQVTRAEADSGIWKTLAKSGTSAATLTVEHASNALRQTIETKAARTASAQRTESVLVLDATETAGHALDAVVSHFRQRHGQWATGLGYGAIWLVGPNRDLTHRLDIS